MAERQFSSSSSDEEATDIESWIEWFCKQDGNEFFCEVDQRYVEDNFNLYGLKEIIGTDYRKCLDVILDRIDAGEMFDHSVQKLYGLIHARFIITKRGQDKMKRRFRNAEFGFCPLLSCEQQPVLPVGLSDQINQSRVMVFCPRCNQVMLPTMHYADDIELDGAYFGTTFPHLFLMQFPELLPAPPLQVANYIPKVFGFKVRYPTIRQHMKEVQQKESKEKVSKDQDQVMEGNGLGNI
eukprot:maker-scaffold_16-snap-gene-2.56-mRNA-1 protein AED:0.30 eAED:0.30 QI:142/1/1/1/1/1/2/52/237